MSHVVPASTEAWVTWLSVPPVAELACSTFEELLPRIAEPRRIIGWHLVDNDWAEAIPEDLDVVPSAGVEIVASAREDVLLKAEDALAALVVAVGGTARR